MKIINFVSLFLILVSCNFQNEVTVTELNQLIENESNIQILDVRTPEEWNNGTIKNTIKINFNDIDFIKNIKTTINKNKEVYIYCNSGRRSKKAVKLLNKEGYKAINIKGGYKVWKSQIQRIK